MGRLVMHRRDGELTRMETPYGPIIIECGRDGGRTRLVVDAPPEVKILREEAVCGNRPGPGDLAERKEHLRGGEPPQAA